MSREQWGHGYWSGYEACRNEEERFSIKKPTDYDVILATANAISFGRSYVPLNFLVSLLSLGFFESETNTLKAIRKCGERFDCGVSEDGKYFMFNTMDAVSAQDKINNYCDKIKMLKQEEK